MPTLTFIRGLKAQRFWDPDSLETVIFNSFIGAAAIFSYEDGSIEILRVNEKCVKEIGMRCGGHLQLRGWEYRDSPCQ